MEYLILSAVLIVIILLALHFSNKRSLKKRIDQVRLSWGKPKVGHYHFDSIRRYADVTKGNPFHRLSDQTVEDIDLHNLFRFIDRTTSKVGQQFLYKKLLEPTDKVSGQSEDYIDLFSNDSKLREEIQLLLLALSDSDAYHISALFQEKLLAKPKWFFLLVIDVVAVLGLLVLSTKFPFLLIVLLVPAAINMFLHYRNKGNTFQFARAFSQLKVLINTSKVLVGKDTILYDTSVDQSIAQLRSFQRKAILITHDGGGELKAELSQLVMFVFELIKAILLVEVITLYQVTKDLEGKRDSILALFHYVGIIDASISIASLRAGTIKTCKPTFVSSRKEFVAKQIYHPLIEDCVENDLIVNGKGVLITGSNMSGKSTFLRTLTINSILAQTINTCFAQEFKTPVLKQFSSIRIDDSLLEGKSYYFEEVSIMASLLEQVDSGHQNLFVLDEVFKGTNTNERIAAAKAILSYLNRHNNIVIVSTHDLELADMLKSEYDLYHFTENVERKQLHFDHKIKAGQLTTRNAIKILELAEYPSEITEEARKISEELLKRNENGVRD